MVSYDILLHQSAERELDALSPDARDRLTDTLTAVAEHEQPTEHQKARMLEGQPGLFRVRVGEVRAICQLSKPHLCVLRVGHRADVYDIIDDIDERAVG